MSGIFKTTVLGKVTKVDGGTSKNGKQWFRANVAVSLYNFTTKKYDLRLINVLGSDKIADAMQKIVQVGCCLFAEGECKPGKPFKTNEGAEITPFDLWARDWSVAGVVPDRKQADSDGGNDNPFDE